MRACARLLHTKVPAAEEVATHLVVTLDGDSTGSKVRPRLGIVPVVDRSGSMAYQHKLAVVASALEHLGGYLCGDDTLALVSFSADVTTDLAPRAVDGAGLVGFTRAVRALRATSSTNLEGGLRAGIAAAVAMPRDALVRVIVLTDGQANVGAATAGELTGLLADLPRNVSVSFIGVGTDCDHDLLGELAQAGGGGYGFVEAPHLAAAVLGAEIGGLLTAAAAEVTVAVQPRAKYAQLAAPLAARSTPDGAGFTVRVGALLEGQRRHLVFPLRTVAPGRTHARPVTVADVTVTAVVDDADVTIPLLPKLQFAAALTAADDEELSDAVELAQVAQAQLAAESYAKAGQFAAAQQVLGQVDLRSGRTRALVSSLAVNYSGADSWTSSAPLRNSAAAMLSATTGLSGSSAEFDALASRTVGTYTTTAQRNAAAETLAEVSGSLGLTATLGTGTGTGVLSAGGSGDAAPAGDNGSRKASRPRRNGAERRG